MISDEAWMVAGFFAAAVGGWVCWWIGFRWRGFLLLAGCTILGAAIWRYVNYWMVYEPSFFLDGFGMFIATWVGAWVGAGASLLGLLAFHVVRRRRQSRHLRSLLLGIGRPGIESDRSRRWPIVGCTALAATVWGSAMLEASSDLAAALVTGAMSAIAVGLICLLVFRMERRRRHRESEAGMDRVHRASVAAITSVEEKVHVKYAPYSNTTRNDDWLLYDDWLEAVDDPEGAAELYLLIPHRSRVRYKPGRPPKLSNTFDCIVLRPCDNGEVLATPASRSPFCRRVMSIFRAD